MSGDHCVGLRRRTVTRTKRRARWGRRRRHLSAGSAERGHRRKPGSRPRTMPTPAMRTAPWARSGWPRGSARTLLRSSDGSAARAAKTASSPLARPPVKATMTTTKQRSQRPWLADEASRAKAKQRCLVGKRPGRANCHRRGYCATKQSRTIRTLASVAILMQSASLFARMMDGRTIGRDDVIERCPYCCWMVCVKKHKTVSFHESVRVCVRWPRCTRRPSSGKRSACAPSQWSARSRAHHKKKALRWAVDDASSNAASARAQASVLPRAASAMRPAWPCVTSLPLAFASAASTSWTAARGRRRRAWASVAAASSSSG